MSIQYFLFSFLQTVNLATAVN